MKANGAPKKIYLQKYDNDILACLNKWNIHEEWTVKPCNEKIATNIEYTRTDAFIEKAFEFFDEHLYEYIDEYIDVEDINFHDFINIDSNKLKEGFKKYMKGE